MLHLKKPWQINQYHQSLRALAAEVTAVALTVLAALNILILVRAVMVTLICRIIIKGNIAVASMQPGKNQHRLFPVHTQARETIATIGIRTKEAPFEVSFISNKTDCRAVHRATETGRFAGQRFMQHLLFHSSKPISAHSLTQTV